MGVMVVAPGVWWQYGNDGNDGEDSSSFHEPPPSEERKTRHARERISTVAARTTSGLSGSMRTYGSPGSSPGAGPDTYAIRVWNTNTGTYYQLGTPMAQVKINGGNIQVKP